MDSNEGLPSRVRKLQSKQNQRPLRSTQGVQISVKVRFSHREWQIFIVVCK